MKVIKQELQFKEDKITLYFDPFIEDMVEYDSVVNQFFLPMIM